MKVAWEINQGVGELILSAPPSNSLTLSFFHQFGEVIREAEKSKQLKAMIIRGKGRHFSSGADLNELLPAIKNDILLTHYQDFNTLSRSNIPIIASISGVCLGAAFELALCCHFRICTPDAVFGMPETTFNLIPAIGGIEKLLKIAGKANAMKLLLGGNTFSADDALSLGVVDKIVSKGEINTFVHNLAVSIPTPYHAWAKRFYLNKFIRQYHLND